MNLNHASLENLLLLGPGPSNTDERVLKATAMPTIGHLDPRFQEMMEEVKSLLRFAFQTENNMTFPLSAPASLAMESGIVNILERGDKAIIAQNGVFGGRMADIVKRCGGELVLVEYEWGTAVTADKLAEAMKAHPDAKLVGFVHAETSTGVQSPAGELCKLIADAGMLSLVDTVTGVGGVPVQVDAWGADIVYSGTQKCLSVPPGLAPMTYSEKATKAISARKTAVQSWFCDLNLVMGYWSGQGGGRSYHHTAPVNAIYGLHEGLRLLKEEGLQSSHQRHHHAHMVLRNGLESLGFTFLVDEAYRLPQLNAIVVPDEYDEAKVRAKLLQDFDIEIGAGLGPLAGKIWRIGLMGANAHESKVNRFLDAFSSVIMSNDVRR